MYRIAGKFGKFGELALSSYWRNLNLAILNPITIGARAIIHICEFLVWRSLPNSPNRQIKNLAKVSYYTVCPDCIMMPIKAYIGYVL